MFCHRKVVSWCAVIGIGRSPCSHAFSSLSIKDSFLRINNKVNSAASLRIPKKEVQLVVVSKTKPVELLQEGYDAGARLFGENYIQELCDKSPQLPSDIQWHFIGHLQTNKVKKLLTSVPNLSVVETVDSLKLAKKLNSVCETVYGDEPKLLSIYCQVNTSSEESKSGVSPSQVAALAKEITLSCPRLKVAGLMTIGAPNDIGCFDSLVTCREDVARALNQDLDSLQLSMGMSGDFEEAIARGSTSVRVGSSIFGARDYTK
mmetsp:Transcript_53483/g.68636  ORF Transcript_53483/g.68636 Transcript_53483/m.68636 type:complete len:261 (-) Transcript_53483:163-945(-)